MNDFISIGNWRHQCIKQIKKMLDGTEMLPGVHAVFDEALAHLESAVRFVLPPGMGRWYEVKPDIDLSVDRLPFARVVFEYGPQQHAPSNQVVINGQTIGRDHACSRRLIYAEQHADRIALKFFFYDDAEKMWVLYPFGAWLQNKESSGHIVKPNISGMDVSENSSYFLRPFPLGVFGAAVLASGITYEQAWLDMQEESHVIGVVLEMLGCKNVRPERVSNKTKVSAKVPAALKDDYYRMAVINTKAGHAVSDGESTGDAGERPRPSEHLRRGHTYRPKPGMKMWRQGCVVNPGIGPRVVKDYRID